MTGRAHDATKTIRLAIDSDCRQVPLVAATVRALAGVAGFPEEGGWHLSGEDIKAALEVITSGGNEEIAERNGGG